MGENGRRRRAALNDGQAWKFAVDDQQRDQLTNGEPMYAAPASPLPALLTLSEAALLARTSPSTIRHWLAIGRLDSVKPGRRRLIRRADLAALLGTSADELGR